MTNAEWPYLPTIVRILLALAVGLFVGFERERHGKEAGLRTFAFASLMGGLGGLLGEQFALLSLILIGLLVAFLNVNAIRAGEGPELTTSAALLVTGFAGILCGQGHTLTPAAVAVMTAALLAWKSSLAGFTLGLSEPELRSAILLAILAFVIYPALPNGNVDPWGAVNPRAAWTTVILIAGTGFVNYIFWRIYGTRGIELAGFLGGLVNSSVTVSELSARVDETNGQLVTVAYRAIIFATCAMLLRNAVLLAILARQVLTTASLSLILMLVASAILTFKRQEANRDHENEEAPLLKLESPFSLKSAIKFGLFFLALQVAGVFAQNTLGQVGVYAVSLIGGLFSSSSAVAASAALYTKGTISAQVAGTSAVIASMSSILINLPLVLRANERRLTKRLAWSMGIILIAGIVGAVIQIVLN